MEVTCPECGDEFDVDEHIDGCPHCGFSAEECSHPMSYRESERVYDVGEGERIERVFCGKCGMNVKEM